MANETTYALISSLIPSIWEAALMYAQETFFMPNLVTVYTNQTGMQDRKLSEYSGGTVQTGLGETIDLSTQAFSRAATETLTPTEIGTQFVVTDRRMDTDDIEVMADLSQHIGYTIFKQIEAHLTGVFANLTGGTVGTAGGTITWDHVFAARAILANAAVPPPYNLVLHEYHLYHLNKGVTNAGLALLGPMRVRDDIQSRYYVQSAGDIDIYVAGDNHGMTAGTAVKGAMFNSGAIALDIRRAMRIELQRDASLRATEVNATAIYAYGKRRPLYGVQLIGTAQTPNP